VRLPSLASVCCLLALSLLPLGAHAAEPAAPNGQGTITLKIAGLPTRDRAVTPDSKATLAIADAFLARHPNVRLIPFEGLVIEGMSSMDSGPLMAMAGGIAPEVLYVNFRLSETYISQGFLYPLDKYVDQWLKEEPEVITSEMIPKQVWDVMEREGPNTNEPDLGRDGKKHIWAAPYGVVVMALMYRKDLYKKAGLDPNHPPQNWDELYDFALRTSWPEQGIWGLGMYTKQDAAWNFMSLLWSAGSDAVVQDQNGDWRAAYDDEGAVKATKFYWQLRRGLWTTCDLCERRGNRTPVVFWGKDSAKCPVCGKTITVEEAKAAKKLHEGVVDGDPAASRGWARGKISMMFQYLRDSFISDVNPNQVGIAPVPKGPDGHRGSEINATMMGINATIKDPQIRDLAWEYIRFFASMEARKIRTRTFVEAGFAKYIQPKWLQMFGFSEYLRDVPKGWAETLDIAIHDSKPEPFGKNCQLIYREMQYPLDEAIAEDNPDIPTILKKNVEATNIKLMGRIPPAIKRQRDIITTIAVILMAAAFILLMRASLGHYSRQISQTTSGAHTQTVGGHRRRKFIYAWIVMAPALASIALWQYYPLVVGSGMAFQDYKILLGSHLVGISNFSQAFFDVDFWLTMLRTVQYAGLALILGFGAPILLALLLHEVPKGKMFYRVIFYLPAVTVGVVIFMLWKQFYDPSPQGMLNQVLGFFHIGPQKFLQDASHPLGWVALPAVAMICVILPQIWAGVGPGCIIYLAALQSVPEEIYEAADLDGCGFWGKFWRITIPWLKALIIINFVGAFIGAFRAFEPIFIMTAGGPAKQTTVLGLEIWFNAYVYLKYGFAVSMAWVLGSLLIGFTVMQLRILSRLQFRTAQAK
jgi:ABC-type sugar transport system permease subunit/ABC-type glycerol-3-phosphate transport system substrate-binding protein